MGWKLWDLIFFLRPVGGGVYIRCCGNGCLGFRPYGGSLFSDAKKVTKKALPHHSVPRLGSACPHSGIAPWARREGPSLAQRGYLGILAEVPTAQRLRSAIVVNGALRSKSKAQQEQEPACLWRLYFDPSVGASLLAKAQFQLMKMLAVPAS
jgi:hypothetical protein